jgi:hypothetical protein
MTVESERETFRGVVCLHCKEPIPVPHIVIVLQDAGSQGPESLPEKSQVFNLRCSACHKEKPYRVSEIMDFEGSPEKPVPPIRPATVRWFPDELTKSAKA